MHQNKDIKKLSEINDFFSSGEKVSDTFIDMLKIFRCRGLTLMLNSIKKRGYCVGDLLSILLLFPFAGVSSVRALFYSGLATFSQARKDAYYRLKNSESINWRKLQWLIAKRFMQKTAHKTKTTDPRCLIVDDSLLMKTSCFTEGVSRVFDHVMRKHVWGYKQLVLGYWDGKSFLPLDFSLHREKGKNKKKPYGMSRSQKKQQYSKLREKGSYGSKRKKELNSSKIRQTNKMIRRAFKHGFSTDYVLCDSWFFCHSLLQCVRRIKKNTVQLIAMATMGKAKYEFKGKLYKPSELKQHLKKNKKRSRKLKAVYIECVATYQGIPVKMFFVRYRGQKKWKLIVTTDLSLHFAQTIKIYSIRWSIEVFFKEAKQHLFLGKSQSRDFDAQIADATIVMIQYIMLALHKRINNYETIGQLFKQQSRQLVELTIAERIWYLILEIITEICDILEVDPEHLFEKLVNGDKQRRTEKLLFSLLNTENQDESKKAA